MFVFFSSAFVVVYFCVFPLDTVSFISHSTASITLETRGTIKMLGDKMIQRYIQTHNTHSHMRALVSISAER